MVLFSKLTCAVAALGLAGIAITHPGETHSHAHMKREILARDNLAAIGKRSLGACAGSERAQQAKKRALKRRFDKVQNLRKKRGITTRKFT